MRQPSGAQIATLLCGVGLLALGSEPPQAQKRGPAPPARSSTLSAASSRIWTSNTTGKEYRVRTNGDRFYAEWVNIPKNPGKQRPYIRSEALRSGSKWVGVSHSLRQCSTGEKSGSQQDVVRWCHLTTRIEIDSVSRDKITGHGETLREFDCKTCKILQTGWGDFVWVPKGAASPRKPEGRLGRIDRASPAPK